MKPPILIAMPLPPPLRDRLTQHYEVHGPLDRTKPLPLPEHASEARALVTLGSLKTDAAMMDALPHLGLIACYGTGFEGVDRDEARRRGVELTHAGEANAAAVAEFALGLTIAVARNLVRGDQVVRAGDWPSLSRGSLPATPGLAGRRLGIYGMGAIGMKIAGRAAAFDMQIGYHNRSRRTDTPHAYFGSLPDLATWCDVLVIGVRASAETRHAVNAEILAALGPSGILVNISRGLVVDELALCAALETGQIGGAGLDVYESEPHVPERLRALNNTVLTPHMAALEHGALAAQQDVLIGNLQAFFEGRPLNAVVPRAPERPLSGHGKTG